VVEVKAGLRMSPFPRRLRGGSLDECGPDRRAEKRAFSWRRPGIGDGEDPVLADIFRSSEGRPSTGRAPMKSLDFTAAGNSPRCAIYTRKSFQPPLAQEIT